MSQPRKTVAKHVLDARYVRQIKDGFSWIDRRFVGEGWIDRLTLEESALYFFLVAVADRDGLSFYSDGRIGTTLRLRGEDLTRARMRLVELGLLAWEAPLYQVLDLPQSLIEGRRRGLR